jgi:hypothetical protein
MPLSYNRKPCLTNCKVHSIKQNNRNQRQFNVLLLDEKLGTIRPSHLLQFVIPLTASRFVFVKKTKNCYSYSYFPSFTSSRAGVICDHLSLSRISIDVIYEIAVQSRIQTRDYGEFCTANSAISAPSKSAERFCKIKRFVLMLVTRGFDSILPRVCLPLSPGPCLLLLWHINHSSTRSAIYIN